MFKKGWNKFGQITVFIIVAIIILAAAGVFFIIKGQMQTTGISANLDSVYTAFLSCIEEDALVGINVLESQGGYIELPEFEAGSAYMPFSSQLNFLGNPIPYWYYVSGNNIQKEQIPSLRDMEGQLGYFIEERIHDCLLDSYLESGYGVSMGEEVEASIDIREEEVEINLEMLLGLERANDTASVRDHNVVVKSKLGQLYKEAIEIYDYEQDTLFLENYGIDTLRLYAPVDGVELTCSPKVWNAEEIFDELQLAIEANTNALKIQGGDFELSSRENRYFVVGIPGIESDVLFWNSRNWSSSFEVNPSEENVLMAKPVGTHPGMGVLGFCYVPYHFVYSINYPVLVQVYSGQEIFQFPLAVVIKGNKPREALDSSAIDTPEIELCDYKNTAMSVEVYDTSLNPIVANISFECFGESCNIGTTGAEGTLVDLFPQCINGFVVARAEGYKSSRENVATTAQEGIVVLIMDKNYKKNVNLKLDGKDYHGEAIINFISNDTSATVLYPGKKEVELSEGQYEVHVYIYRNASIELDEQTQEQCVEVPQGGLGALFGATDEECFDITIPSQIISNALMGGGKQNYYFVESELQGGTIMDINAQSLPAPSNIEDLQKNYIEFEDKGLDINFR